MSEPGRTAHATPGRTHHERPGDKHDEMPGRVPDVDVLVVGAGPAGLALALQATSHGARVAVVDRRPDHARPSRAMVVQPRTLEVLKPIGAADALRHEGTTGMRATLHFGSRDVPVALGDLGIGDSPYPHLLFVRQAQVEAVLRERLRERGVDVHWGQELLSFDQDAGGVSATVATAGGPAVVRCRYLAGCDGADSTVRRLLRVPFRGGGYRQSVLLADVEVAGAPPADQAHVYVGGRGLLFLFAGGERAPWRLIAGSRGRREAATPAETPVETPVDAEDVQKTVAALAPGRVAVTKVAWAAEIPLQHRLADSYRHGRAFLCGDAAHVHSPAGAQGMNTGIQDACNLGWKLALAARGAPRPDALLDSYQAERRPVARCGIAWTTLAWWGEVGGGRPAQAVRWWLAPRLAPMLAEHIRWMSAGVRLFTGLSVRYPPGRAAACRPRTPGPVRDGDRMPDAPLAGDGGVRRLHDYLAEPAFHAVLYGDSGSWHGLDLLRAVGPWLRVVTVAPGEPPAGIRDAYGDLRRVLRRGPPVQYLVRPDGYVAFHAEGSDLRPLAAEAARWLPRARTGAAHRA